MPRVALGRPTINGWMSCGLMAGHAVCWSRWRAWYAPMSDYALATVPLLSRPNEAEIEGPMSLMLDRRRE